MKLLSLFIVCLFSVQASAQNFEKGYADLVKKVGKGVVNISTFAKPKVQPYSNSDEQFRRFFEDFFGGQGFPGGPGGQPGPRVRPAPRAKPRSEKAQPYALGTGFVIDESGLILTNQHVVGGADEVKVQFQDNDALVPAEIIGRDPDLDIALLKIKSKEKLTVLPLGDSDKMDVGEFVLAIGNPLGYGHSVTHGILSAKERQAPELSLGKYLQTDASINPGNSGGPLINMRGEVIGINNAIDARAQGIGFAIPINSVKSILTQLKTKGTVSRGYLGVGIGDLTPEIAEQLKIKPETKGVMVAEVAPGQPGDKAGLKPYDVITAVNGQAVGNARELTQKITAIDVGKNAEITLIRDGKERKLTAKVSERPTDLGRLGRGQPHRMPRPEQPTANETLDQYGLRVAPLDADNSKVFGIPLNEFKNQKRIVVVDLARGGAAAESGLQEGDVILDVGGKEISNNTQLESALKSAKGKSLMLRIKRYEQGEGTVSVIMLSTP